MVFETFGPFAGLRRKRGKAADVKRSIAHIPKWPIPLRQPSPQNHRNRPLKTLIRVRWAKAKSRRAAHPSMAIVDVVQPDRGSAQLGSADDSAGGNDEGGGKSRTPS
ncbi:hypothetical protein NL676_034458 [Syzygium grande]|nr:hypothetical protein NL676_034458 [Syzygium grande]